MDPTEPMSKENVTNHDDTKPFRGAIDHFEMILNNSIKPLMPMNFITIF